MRPLTANGPRISRRYSEAFKKIKRQRKGKWITAVFICSREVQKGKYSCKIQCLYPDLLGLSSVLLDGGIFSLTVTIYLTRSFQNAEDNS